MPDIRVQRGKTVFAPTPGVEREIAEGLDDIRKGRTYGPYGSPEEAIRVLRGMASKSGPGRSPVKRRPVSPT